MNMRAFRTGIRRGLPVGVGYFSVAFGFGAMAAAEGIRALDAARRCCSRMWDVYGKTNIATWATLTK